MNQPNQPYSKAGLWTIRVVQIILAVTVLFALLMIWALLRGDQEPSSYQIDQHSQDVGGERSAFKIYQDKLLVAVPSGGYYHLAQADIESIRLLSDDYSARHIAVDKNYLYCGNHTIAELNPATSDGEQVYFDQRLLDLTSNPDLLSIRFGIRDHYLFDPKTQNYYLEDQAFPAKNAPYKMLNPSDDHADHALFLSPKGIYFYHKRNQKIERAGENPFSSQTDPNCARRV